MALQKVRHPGVCGIVDMELDDALAFIVTELIEGKNLREDVRVNGRYVGDDLERLARKLIEAVQAVHAAGIVHRDIKPTNVMVSNTGPMLVDFGIAMGEGESHVTRTGLVMGTPASSRRRSSTAPNRMRKPIGGRWQACLRSLRRANRCSARSR